MGSPLIQYPELVDLATEGGYNENPALSQLSAVFLLSSCVVMRQRWLWQSPLIRISEAEWQSILAMIGMAEAELMTSAGIGTIVPSINDLSSNPRYLRLDGSLVAQADYPELTPVVPAGWIVGADIQLPDMREKSLHGDDTTNVGQIVGENEVTLLINEMPSHTHVQNPHSHGYVQGVGAVALGGEIPATASIVTPTPSTTSPATATNQDAGGDQPHNNVPASLSVYWWVVAS